MSQQIHRIEYMSIPNVAGNEHAEFLRDNFNSHEESASFNIEVDVVNKLLKRKNLNAMEKTLLTALKAECKAHGDFSISIA